MDVFFLFINFCVLLVDSNPETSFVAFPSRLQMNKSAIVISPAMLNPYHGSARLILTLGKRTDTAANHLTVSDSSCHGELSLIQPSFHLIYQQNLNKSLHSQLARPQMLRTSIDSWYKSFHHLEDRKLWRVNNPSWHYCIKNINKYIFLFPIWSRRKATCGDCTILWW